MDILPTLLATKPDLCGKPFDVKVDDVRFVGYPMLLAHSKEKVSSSGKSSHKIISFNVVLVVRVRFLYPRIHSLVCSY